MSILSAWKKGFTLLEAIVALLLISLIGMAVFTLMSNNLDSMMHIKDHELQEEAIRNGMEYIKTVNIMERPTGDAELESFNIHWDSHLLTPIRDGVGHLGGISLYELGLYEVKIIVSHDEKQIAKFKMQRTGFRQIRQNAKAL